MIDRLRSIADRIKVKIEDESFINHKFKHWFAGSRPDVNETLTNFNTYISAVTIIESEEASQCIQYMLVIACEFNLLNEFHSLLELNLFKNIDHPLQFTDKKIVQSISIDNGKTLLGIAAFHGHLEIVAYLVEVRLARINAQDKEGNTALHQVARGDSHPFNHDNFGVDHDKVADYLIKRGGDLSIKNNLGHTPYTQTKLIAPLSIERMAGRRFLTNTGSASFYADKVRPIFEIELKRQQEVAASFKGMTSIRVMGVTQEEKAEDFKRFCLKHAVEIYVKSKILSFEYTHLNQLYKDLQDLAKQDHDYFELLMASQKPDPYSFKYGPIASEIPAISKKCAILGLLVGLATYYKTRSILIAAATGSFAAVFVWACLTENNLDVKLAQEKIEHERIDDLRTFGRFFPAQRSANEVELSIPHARSMAPFIT